MDSKEDQEIINNICEYVEKNEIKDMLQEYLKRLIISKPDDPINFLIDTIQDRPYKISSNNTNSTNNSSNKK